MAVTRIVTIKSAVRIEKRGRQQADEDDRGAEDVEDEFVRGEDAVIGEDAVVGETGDNESK